MECLVSSKPHHGRHPKAPVGLQNHKLHSTCEVKKKKEKSELCGLEPQKDTLAPKRELCLGLLLSPASGA